MDERLSYETYLNSLMDIVGQLGSEITSQGTIDQQERDMVSGIENKYMALSEELHKAQKTVREQYASVWDSCTKGEGIKRPRNMRPLETSMKWRDAVRIQEHAASLIREWFANKTQRAIEERQKIINEEAAKRAALALAQAEAAKRRAEAEAEAEKRRGEALIEELKRKYRR